MKERIPPGMLIEPRGHLIYLISQLAQERETTPIQIMLRDSPMVMWFLLNSGYYDPTFIQNMLVRLTSLYNIKENELKKAMDYTPTYQESGHYEINDLIVKYIIPGETGETPLFQIFKGLAICTKISTISNR
jgi:hypothetical protein